MILDDLVDSILTIGNHPAFKKLVEPQVMQPLKLESWMVKRVLIAYGLLLEAKNE